VLAGNAVARRLSRWQYARLIATRLAGVALFGFGVKLAFNNR
jgi:leucine efflux protein